MRPIHPARYVPDKPTLTARSCTNFLIGNAYLRGIMIVSCKKRYARCASGKAGMDIMTGDKYLSIYTSFNNAIRV
jgi:hypothetical protein